MIKLRQKNKYDTSYKLLQGKESGSDEEVTELLVKNKPQRINFPTIDKLVEEGDTLQALAIKYHCSVAELKRINNIHNENEIFAKMLIKVPHRPFTSVLASVHISGNSSPNDKEHHLPSTGKLIDIDIVNSKLTETIHFDKNEVNEIIFNSQIIQKPNERLTNEIVDEDVRLLPQNEEKLADEDPIISRLSCNGADADFSWKILIGLVVLLILALPLILIFFVVDVPNHTQHQHPHGS